MGLFLQTAIFPGSGVGLAREAVRRAAAEPEGYELTPERCRYWQHEDGAQVLFGDECPGLGKLAEALSDAGRCPVLLLHIYDGETWGFHLCDRGKEMDRFDPVPDLLCPVTEFQRGQAAGKPEVAAAYFPEADEAVLSRYLVPWTEELTGEEARFACPGDRFPYGDCWQLADFTARLGYPWPFEEEREEPAPVLPTLEQILAQNLPPCPVPPGDWEGVVPMLGKLPSALDPAYIRRLLEEEGMGQFWDRTPTGVLLACEERRVQIRPRLPERDPFCRRLSVLAAFCARWLGDPAEAFWNLYNATDNAVCAPNGGGPVDVETLRARSMAVPLMVKRHIAQKDLGRLMELDPDNRDVYLLCRAWLCSIRPYGQERLKAQADLEELARLGGVRRDDPRLDLSGFGEAFLARPGVLAQGKDAPKGRRLGFFHRG